MMELFLHIPYVILDVFFSYYSFTDYAVRLVSIQN
jgi:hypothetical protein